MAQEIRFVGLDIGKFEIYAYDAGRGAGLTVTNTAAGHSDLVDWLDDPGKTIIALEPTGAMNASFGKA